MRVIGYFWYDDEKFYIVKSDDGFLVGKEKGNVITFKLNKNDKDIIKKVVDGLVPDGKFVELLPMKVNGHSYKTRYCINKGLYVFEGASGYDLMALNSLWNNQYSFVAINLKNKIHDTYQRVVMIGKKMVVVVLVSTFALGMATTLKSDVYKELDSIPDEVVEEVIVDDTTDIDSSRNETSKIEINIKNEYAEDGVDFLDTEDLNEQEVIDNVLEKETVVEVSPVEVEEVSQTINDEELEKEQEITVDKIKETINNNPNLSKEEKDLILSNSQIFEDYLEYFDEEQLQIFSELSTVYHEEENPYMNVAGTFTPGENVMDFYSVDGFASTLPEVFTHEFCHSLQQHYKGTSSWLIEGLNAIINNEYYGNEYGYDYQRKIVYGLSNLVGNDCLINCSLKDGELVVKDALYEFIPDADLIDRFFAFNSVLYDNIFSDNLTTQEVNYFEGEIKYMFSQFYEAKYGKNMDDDLVMLYLLDYDNFIKKFKEQYDIQMDDDILLCVCEGNYMGKIFKYEDLNKGYISATVPVDAKKNIVESLTFEEAVEAGIVIMHDDGTYELLPTPYQQDENGMFYRQEIIYSDEVNNYVIDENNRYLNSEMNR